MRSYYHLLVACATVLALGSTQSATAQDSEDEAMARATFHMSNNDAAWLIITRLDETGTRIQFSQDRDDAAYIPLSKHTVLRDANTGVAHPIVKRRIRIDRETNVETIYATFEPFPEVVKEFEVINPKDQNGNLWFTKVRYKKRDLAMAKADN